MNQSVWDYDARCNVCILYVLSSFLHCSRNALRIVKSRQVHQLEALTDGL